MGPISWPQNDGGDEVGGKLKFYQADKVIIKKLHAANARRLKRLRLQPEVVGTICTLNTMLKIEVSCMSVGSGIC